MGSRRLISSPGRAALTASLALGIIGQSSSAFAQVVQDRTVSRITATESGSCAIVNVQFNVPVRYQSHFPATQGRELRVSVSPLSYVRGSTGFGAESVRPPDSRLAGIQQITYDLSDPAGPTLIFLFDHVAHWTVEPDKDATRLLVHLTTFGRSCDEPNGGGQTAAAPSAVNPILTVTHTVPATLEPNGNYSINLASDQGDALHPETVKQLDLFNRYAAYTTTSEENGSKWARLRLGMFATHADADAVLAEVQKVYPEAWIVRLDRSERDTVYRAWLAARAELGAATDNTQTLPVNPEAEALLTELKAHLAAGENADAVRVAEAILGLPDSPATPEAQELLGLARERAGQLAHAKAEYETFLKRFPDNEAAPRVRQRLAALLSGGEETAETAPQAGAPSPRRASPGEGMAERREASRLCISATRAR